MENNCLELVQRAYKRHVAHKIATPTNQVFFLFKAFSIGALFRKGVKYFVENALK